MGDSRHRLVVDGYKLCGIFCGGKTCCNNHCNDLATMVRFLRCHWEMRWDEGVRAVFIDERDVCRMPCPDRVGYRLQTVIQQILAGHDGEHAAGGAGSGRIDGADDRMRVR